MHAIGTFHVMLALLDRLHAALRRSRWLARLVLVTRLLLAIAFIPTGLVKVLGRRFTSLSVDTPIGAFFEAMFRTGGYWQFLGWAQVTAGVLLLIPATASLGALLFLALAVNIFVLTLSLGFVGTPIITGLMLLAVLFLVAWDYHRWRSLLVPAPGTEPPVPDVSWARGELELYALGATAGLIFFLGTRDLVPVGATRIGLVVALLAAVALAGLWLRQAIVQRRG